MNNEIYLIPKKRTNIRLNSDNNPFPSIGGVSFLIEFNPDQTWFLVDYADGLIKKYAIHMSGDKSVISPYIDISHISSIFDVYINGKKIENLSNDELMHELDMAIEKKYKSEVEKYGL